MTSVSSLPASGDGSARRDHRLVGVAHLLVGGGLLAWALVWPVPTEVMGEGVLLPPGNAGLLNARASGQIRSVAVEVGSPVTRGQVLMELRLPVLDRQLQQQRGNLAQLERINQDLEDRDRRRLQTETQEVTTALAKLSDDARRYRALQQTYAGKLRNLEWLSRREVVAPLSPEVVTTEQSLTTTSVNLDDVAISRRRLLADLAKVKLEIETQAQQRRYRIDDLQRQIRVSEARIAYDGQVVAERDGRVLDLQVIQGQTVAMGQRLGTIGRADDDGAGGGRLRAVAYFAPADARRLPVGLPVEVVPQWKQRGRFGGIVGRVTQVLSLPATEEDVSTTTGNPQLARELTRNGPVMRAEIRLDQDPTSRDGFRWTISRGSAVFPVREGLTVTTHAYVEWRAPLSYVLPGWRSLTGGYRPFI
jgi:HlyD family secretion protein